MPYVDVGPTRLYYTDHRQPDAARPPLLLIHGAGATHLDFPIQLRKQHSLALDLPGHGKSGGAGCTSIEAYMQLVIGVLDALALPVVDVMGHSMGGAISLMLALRQPARVRGLILLTTGAYLPVNPQLIEGMTANALDTARMIVRWAWAKEAPEAWREAGLRQMLATPAPVTIGDYWACARFDVRPHLAALTLPTLILGGTQDRMTPIALQDDLAARLPHATRHIIAGGGHMVALEQPEVVTQQVMDWLNDLPDIQDD